MHTLYRERDEVSLRRTQDGVAINACGWETCSSSKDCHQWPCYSHQRQVAEPRCWQLSPDSAGTGSLRHPYWLARQMREGWWHYWSLSWRKSELKRKRKQGFPRWPHQPWRKTRGGGTRKMRWWDEVLAAAMLGEEGPLMVAAVLQLKQLRRHSLNSSL